MPQAEDNWKIKVLVVSTIVGALVGLSTGFLLSRTIEESGREKPDIKTMDAIKAAIGIIGLMRGIAALGSGK
jgi:NhaP-type Na+/H+ or K+/H+ antiporter